MCQNTCWCETVPDAEGFDVLRVLVQNGGHLVEKESLLKEVSTAAGLS
jgi:DNA-binding winged helix-turn-helix (wHTH) protein